MMPLGPAGMSYKDLLSGLPGLGPSLNAETPVISGYPFGAGAGGRRAATVAPTTVAHKTRCFVASGPTRPPAAPSSITGCSWRLDIGGQVPIHAGHSRTVR